MRRPLLWIFWTALLQPPGAHGAERPRHIVRDVQEAGSYSEGLFGVKKDAQWGFADKDGVMKIAPSLAAVDKFSEGLAAAKLSAKWGYLDKAGKFVILPEYEKARGFSEGLAAVRKAGRWGYIDKEGALRIESQFDDALPFSEGHAAVMIGGNWGFIDPRGRIKINPQHLMARGFKDGLAPVRTQKNDDEWGYLDLKGRLAIPAKFDDAGEFDPKTGLAPVQVDSWWGFINERGHIAIQLRFEEARGFFGGLAAVRIKGKWGFIGKDGELAIPAGYFFVDDFRDKLALAADDAGFALLDRKGRVIARMPQATNRTGLPPRYLWLKGGSGQDVLIVNFSKDDLKIVKNTTKAGRLSPRTIKSGHTYTDYDLDDAPDGIVDFEFDGEARDSFRLWFWWYPQGRASMAEFLDMSEDGHPWYRDGNTHFGHRYATDNRKRGERSILSAVSEHHVLSMYTVNKETLVLIARDTSPGYGYLMYSLDYSQWLEIEPDPIR